MDKDTLDFIEANAGSDVRLLALQAGKHPGVDMMYALDQIAGRQAARRKLPSWAAVGGIEYPPHISMEQCSGEEAARYKAALAARLCGGGWLVDITGGLGADFSFMARAFDRATYVERQERLCALARHNFPLLGLGGAEVVCADGADYLRRMGRAAMVYADPARRGASGGRTFAIADCTPDVAALRPLLTEKADRAVVKLSPMLDWRKAVADMGGSVREVHIVSAGGECKELLLVLSAEGEGGPDVHCASGGSVLSYRPGDAPDAPKCADGTILGSLAAGGWHLYEPNPSVMKAGCFGLVCSRYGVEQLAPNSHLFVSRGGVEGFPGREFAVRTASTMNRKSLKRALGGLRRANVAVRNFPMPAAELRRRLGLADGGDTYIFGTTLADRSHVVLVAEK